MLELKNAPPKERRYFLYVIGVIAFTVALIFVFFRFGDFSHIIGMLSNALMPFMSGLVLAFILNAFVTLFEKVLFAPLNRRFAEGKAWNRIRRPLTLLLSYTVLLALVALIIFYIIPELVKSGELFIQTASKTMPVYVDAFAAWITRLVQNSSLNIDIATIQKLFFDNFNLGVLFTDLSKATTDILASVVSATVNVASGLFTLSMSVIYSAYFLSGKEKLGLTCKKLLYAYTPRKLANRASMFFSVCHTVFSKYVKGQLTECVILGSLCYLGMTIIGLDYALLISVILTIAALIPLIGAYIGAIMGALLLLMVTPLDALWFLIFIVILQQFEGNVIYPRVVGSSMGLPGLWTLTAVMVFGSLFGIPGIIIGTPSAAVAYTLLKHNTSRRLTNREITTSVLAGSEMRIIYADLVQPPPQEEEDDDDDKNLFADLGKKLSTFFSKLFKRQNGKH